MTALAQEKIALCRHEVIFKSVSLCLESVNQQNIICCEGLWYSVEPEQVGISGHNTIRASQKNGIR